MITNTNNITNSITDKIEEYRVPEFRVKDKDKNTIDTLIHCFMYQMLIDTEKPPASIAATNGAVYTAVYDSIVLPKAGDSSIIKVIVSFQKHTYGKFAIIRNLRVKAEQAEQAE